MKNIIKLLLVMVSLSVISCASNIDPDYRELDKLCDGNFAYLQDETEDRSLTIKCWENPRGEENATN